MSSLNPIQLQAQNIDLRSQLEEARKRIHDLQILASQNTIHVIEQHGANNSNNEALEALRKGLRTSPEKDLVANLRERLAQAESKLSASAGMIESLRDENIRLKSDAEMAATAATANGGKPEQTSNPLSGGSGELEAKIAALEKQLSGVRTQLATSNADVFRWKSSSTAAQNEMNRLKAELMRLQSEQRAAAAAASSSNNSATQEDLDQMKSLNDALGEQLQEKTLECDVLREEFDKLAAAQAHTKSELAQSQQMLVRVTQQVGQKAGKDSGRIAALEADLAKATAELTDERSENASNEREIATLQAQIRAMGDQMEAEKRARAEADFDKLLDGNVEENRLRQQIREMEQTLSKAEADVDKFRAEHGIMKQLKDKTLLQLSQTSEELSKSREHFQRREQELLAQIAALNQQQQQQQRTSPVPTPVKVAAPASPASPAVSAAASAAATAEAQAKLQADRDSQARDRRKAELMAKLQAKTREDKASAEAIFKLTAASYDKLLKRLREAFKEDAAAGQEEVYYDVLWEYERRIFHLTNDLASMQTIVNIRDSDNQAELSRIREADETKLTILRMQIQDLGKVPQC